MTTTSVLFSAAGAPLPPGEAMQPAAAVPAGRVEAFEQALASQSAQPGAEAPALARPDMDAQERARRGLGLEGAAPATDGDMILDGLQRLRGVFDAREARVSEMMSRTSVDANTMIAMQMEMTNFTLLVDITSKLTGKSTQAFDTLMKGQ